MATAQSLFIPFAEFDYLAQTGSLCAHIPQSAIQKSPNICLSQKKVVPLHNEIKTMISKVRFIDLFAGMGGIRKGLELACQELGMQTECVFTSEIKPAAIKILQQNHPDEIIYGDICSIDANLIPDFDILCAGFPCQAFSSAGKREGFADTRGTLFFEVERIILAKKPKGFILENVEGLVNHDKGKTLETIIHHLLNAGYHVSYRVLNAKDFGIPQDRKRIYIVGSQKASVSLLDFQKSSSKLSDIFEQGVKASNSTFANKLLQHFSDKELYGKSIKDKRGGQNNIHSWDIGLKGEISAEDRQLLNKILTERRKHQWAEQYGIDWMDGMPLTLQMIQSFAQDKNLADRLNNLVQLGYLVYEHPKKKVISKNTNGQEVTRREYDTTKPKGYNIVAGKLSFEISKILDPNDIAPTLVAMDMNKLYVLDNGVLRCLTHREGLRLFGYPEDFKFDISQREGFDLLGNTVAVPVIKAVAGRLLETLNY